MISATRQSQRAANQAHLSRVPSSLCTPAAAATVSPGAGRRRGSRNWPIRSTAISAASSLLVGGSEEAGLHQQIIGMMQSNMPVRSLAGKGSIKVTAAVLELADLFIGNDAGPMHLAAAVGTPTVAIFGLSNSQAWGPYTGDAPERQAHRRQAGPALYALLLPRPPC